MAIALRPRARASVITSRKGSQALALGARPGDGGHGVPSESVDTSPVVAGFGGSGSVDTPAVVAGFGGHTTGRPPRPRTPIPAAFRYALAVSLRTAVSCSIRRSDQPSRPSARTCCFLSSLKTLLILAQEHGSRAFVNVAVRYLWWPVFRCPSVAGFDRPPRWRAEYGFGRAHPGADFDPCRLG